MLQSGVDPIRKVRLTQGMILCRLCSTSTTLHLFCFVINRFEANRQFVRVEKPY